MILDTAKAKSGEKDAMQEHFSNTCRGQDGVGNSWAVQVAMIEMTGTTFK